ncbi:hypothetical protein EDWATA_00540 [Edwardsiella tarda ATCC 23685]|uniref:Uncharacterized protein n=1 Tax=Edwardsiella tarda ATCC 23685 TaxID=500638 RepID=D4F1F5_EDWTA|nr:hypothetical protein EDWATA_00540 [Edwardsiella tarda ATCC 23685]
MNEDLSIALAGSRSNRCRLAMRAVGERIAGLRVILAAIFSDVVA